MKLLFKVSLLTLVFSAGVCLVSPSSASAITGSEFQPGRIIDDGVFFDGNGMNVSQIQTFLNSKVASCDTWGTQPYAGTTAGSYGASKGYPPPYVCLKDFGQDTWNIPADAYCNGFQAGSKSAAQIIYDVGVSCGINPKVILVTLQKEQSLVTDNWPWGKQYNAATGYACPDTAPCDPNFSGFFRQVYYGARQFKRYAKDAHIFTSYRPYRTNYIQYNPNSGCGGANVYVQNQATSGLYIYTPYQPNGAALQNLYGTGDGCSAYGNRNFWRMFYDWFGNPLAIPFSASFKGVGPVQTTSPVEEKTLWFEYQNTGINFWKDDASALPYYPRTRLAGSWPINRVSDFAATSWTNSSRPASVFNKVYERDGTTLTPDQHTVWPGQIARFEFKLKHPENLAPGWYQQYFELVQDGSPSWWVNGSQAWQHVIVPNRFQAEFKNVSPAATVRPDQKSRLSFDFKNTGANFWKDDASALPYYPRTRLAGSWPINRVSDFADESWLNGGRPTSVFSKVFWGDGVTLAPDQHTVWPGQIARFEFDVKYPAGGIANGTYKEHFELVQDGSPTWWVPGGYAWQAVNASQ